MRPDVAAFPDDNPFVNHRVRPDANCRCQPGLGVNDSRWMYHGLNSEKTYTVAKPKVNAPGAGALKLTPKIVDGFD